ncbi:hypothetical protein HZB02_06660 [Candidatus Woesearchaeota archaeon]|nr:hypothetical protein [Candidatus Woesearchaeota archaeon]
MTKTTPIRKITGKITIVVPLLVKALEIQTKERKRTACEKEKEIEETDDEIGGCDPL